MAIIKPSGVLVKDIMTTNVVSTRPEANLMDATRLMSEHNFDGLPVVDGSNKLVGLITEYDMLLKCASVNFPNPKDVQMMSGLKVEDVMNKDPLTIKEDATYEEALKMFKDHHRVNPIPVVDENGRVTGVISRYDILKPLYTINA